MRVWLWIGGIIVLPLFLGATCYVLAHHVLHGPVDARSLHLSVNDAARDGDYSGRAEGRRCRRDLGAREWLCTVDERFSSNAIDYRVRVHRGDSCWEGVVTHPARGMPRQISGCVHLLEELF